jgi:hypothetical protein
MWKRKGRASGANRGRSAEKGVTNGLHVVHVILHAPNGSRRG